jgi:hypothetical protein
MPQSRRKAEAALAGISDNTSYVVRYLRGRGIHPVIINYCLKNELLFETKDYHNALFVGYDARGAARYGNLRGTMGAYKGEVSGSDKHFSFSTPVRAIPCICFESAID